jgi:hypothetical protein
MKVFVHTRAAGNRKWRNVPIELSKLGRLPVVGDYIALSSNDEDWHLVQLVLHNPSATGKDYAAELFCVAVHFMAAKNAMASDPGIDK